MQQDNTQLSSELFTSCSEIIGVSSFHRYLYVFLPQKIAIYEHLTFRTKPELIQQIHVPQRLIRLFDISEDFIAVLFVDGGLQVRKRGYWEVMVYQDRIHEKVDQLEISGSKIIYSSVEGNATKYGFIDLKNQFQQRFFNQETPFEKLIFRHQLGTIPDFYIGYQQAKKIQFGMLYGDEGNLLKKFQFGILPENLYLKDLLLTQINKVTWLVQINECTSKENGENEIQLIIKKFYEQKEMQKKEVVDSEPVQDKKLKIFESMLYQMQQIQKNMNCSPNQSIPSIEPLLGNENQSKPVGEVIRIKNSGCYQNCFIKEDVIWICTQKQIHKVALGKNELNLVSSGKSSERIMNVYDGFFIFESRTLMMKRENVGNGEEKNEKISCMVEMGVQTEEEQNLSDSRRELSINPQIVDEKYLNQKENKSISDKKTIKDENQLAELTERLSSLNKNIEKNILKTIYEYVKEEHEKVKQTTLQQLRRFVQSLVSKEVAPIIDEHISDIMMVKMKEASEYLQGLAGRNLISMNEQIQKERIKEQAMKNMFMMKQADEISELKRIVEFLIEVCKKKQCQKMSLFSQVKESIEKLSNRVVSLEEKVDFLIDGEELKETKMLDEIQFIKSMIKSKHSPPSFVSFDKQKQAKNSEESVDESQSSYSDSLSEQSIEEEEYHGKHHYPSQHPIPQHKSMEFYPMPSYQPYMMPMQNYPPMNYQIPQIAYGYPSQNLSMTYGAKGQFVGMNQYSKYEDSIEQERRKKKTKKKVQQRKK